MIRTKEWKYIIRFPEGPNELYNLVDDPDEETNLSDDPTKQEIRQHLADELRVWFDQYADPKFDWVKESIYERG
jgi:arylsulfatase A-like enzyme